MYNNLNFSSPRVDSDSIIFFSEITQDIASKGLALVYEVCSTEQKDLLVSELVGTLMTGKRKTTEVTADTQVFEEGAIGKTPEG